jgi:pimeloyl-ACP methyl ester carboxylesterase
VLALFVAACGPAATESATPGATGLESATSSPPVTTSTPTVTPSSESVRLLDGEPMTACHLNGISALCGTLTVPENRDGPAGRRIDLRVAVIPTRSPDPQPDPVFLLAGGPGGAATETFAWASGTFSAVNRDFVLVDQRGTGGSNRLVIPPAPDLAGLEGSTRDAAVRGWMEDALAAMPGDPRFYTTAVAMDDLDAVRAALGYDQINLYGGSYGATAAQYYLRQHEDHVRAVVLDGGTLLDVPVFERIALNTQRALDLLFDRCAGDARCHAAFPDLAHEFDVVAERLQTKTVVSKFVDPRSGEPMRVDPISFASAVHSALISADSSSRVPALLHLAYLEDWESVARAAAAEASQVAGDDDQLAMSAVIRCSEAWARYDPDEVARLGAGTFELETQLAEARAQADVCRYLPAGVVPANDADPVRSERPVLLILGNADPQDPPSNVADAPDEMPNSLTVVVPGHGHTVGHLGCMPSIVTAFIKAGTTAGLDVSCAATDVPLPSFRLSN